MIAHLSELQSEQQQLHESRVHSNDFQADWVLSGCQTAYCRSNMTTAMPAPSPSLVLPSGLSDVRASPDEVGTCAIETVRSQASSRKILNGACVLSIFPSLSVKQEHPLIRTYVFF